MYNNANNDIDLGRTSLIAFHNESTKFSNYPYKFDDMVMIASKGKPGIFLEGLGMAVRETGIRESKLDDIMIDLARRSKGQVPNMNTFFSAIGSGASTLTFSDYLLESPTIAKDVALEIGKGAVEVGNAVIDTGKTLTMFLPLVFVGAVIYLIVAKTKSMAK